MPALTQAPEFATIRVAVACSGGRDSMALLHAVARVAAQLARDACPVDVVALHVHHGLSPHADAWLAHVQAQCMALTEQGMPVSFASRHLHLRPQTGQSVEALARHGRYQALAEMAAQMACTLVLLAHHQQDQAETFLLQALRGSGLAGLAGMPAQAQRLSLCWARPWLDSPPEVIAAYVQQHGIVHVEDDSNTDVRFARNRLRQQVMPQLTQSFAGFEAALSRSAAHLADVLACHEQWLHDRLADMGCTQVPSVEPVALPVARWRQHAPGAQRELLRAWFRRVSGCALPHTWVSRLEHELDAAVGLWHMKLRSPDGDTWQTGEMRLYRGMLHWMPTESLSNALPSRGRCQMTSVPAKGLASERLHIDAPGRYVFETWGGALLVTPAQGQGVSLADLGQAELRWRQGGEQFQAAPNRPARSLKKQFQAGGVPPWARHAPVVWSGHRLVFVPGLGMDARIWPAEGVPQVLLHWEPLGA